MSTLNQQTPVGRWVVERPELSRLFEELQIDYCCGGDRPLDQACRDHGLDPAQVIAQLEQVEPFQADETGDDWTSLSLSALCDHIEATHHRYLKAELPRLEELLAKVIGAHGESHPELNEVRQTFDRLRAELEPHMMKEERILFPAIRQLEQSATAPGFPFGSISNPVGMMEHEHDVVGNELKDLRRLTGDYTLPSDACTAYEALLNGLAGLEADLHQHIHKENNVLFPKAIALEAGRI